MYNKIKLNIINFIIPISFIGILILLLIPQIFWARNLTIKIEEFTTEWYKGVFDFIKIFLTFLIATYFWDNYKNYQKILNKEEKLNEFCKSWYEYKSNLKKAFDNFHTSLSDPKIDTKKLSIELNYLDKSLKSFGQLIINNDYINSKLAKEVVYYNYIISPIIVEILKDIDDKKLLKGRKLNDKQTENIERIINYFNTDKNAEN